MGERLARLRGWSNLRKWLVLEVLIGVVASVGAIAFISTLQVMSKLLLETVGGNRPPLPLERATSSSPASSLGRGRSRYSVSRLRRMVTAPISRSTRRTTTRKGSGDE
jgi:hypothetical protein